MSSNSKGRLQPLEILQALGIGSKGYQVIQAEIFQDRWHPPSDVAFPLFVEGIAQAHLERIAACLAQAYPCDHQVHWIQGCSLGPGQSIVLSVLASEELPADCQALLVPPLDEESSIPYLANILARLRAPGGCPWDQEQTLESMRIQILSEVHEVIEAIDLQDEENLQEELGDLIMDALFMVHIALTDGKFQLADVINGICKKMIRRHPHVYGDISLPDSESVLSQWDVIKKAEKASRNQTQHPFDTIPDGLPALEATKEILSKARKNGMVFPELAACDTEDKDGSWTEEKLGRELWKLVQSAASDGVNAEAALRKQNNLIRNRYQTLP